MFGFVKITFQNIVLFRNRFCIVSFSRMVLNNSLKGFDPCRERLPDKTKDFWQNNTKQNFRTRQKKCIENMFDLFITFFVPFCRKKLFRFVKKTLWESFVLFRKIFYFALFSRMVLNNSLKGFDSCLERLLEKFPERMDQ